MSRILRSWQVKMKVRINLNRYSDKLTVTAPKEEKGQERKSE
jgi:hypothetical protein